MHLSSPLDAVASAVHHAALLGLPDFHYRVRDNNAFFALSAAAQAEARRTGNVPEKPAVRRPRADECEVYAMFAQTWGSTALGFGGIGGAAMTPAYTVVVAGPSGHFAVYWAGRLAYVVDGRKQTDEQRNAFQQDLANRWTESVIEAVSKYGAVELARG
ncbi:hypothetical protein KTD31_02175 [Burkholderia multivorans]|jgi:hypothetical protein|uniref:hypothetical protein n=1 Tax=Burkholderia multivorans TaxID=87883 RepID=UPI001C21643D|nr:hypothetical protein [Burkholderia multivorans]MBU9200212.1 hypothetical protein [Burkholderia multivorans]MDN8078661.1 hypothetical protein [Burkholderia multivorans]